MSSIPLVPLPEVVDIHDYLREPVSQTERNKRQGIYPYFGATGQVGWIDDYRQDGKYVLLGEDGAPFLDPEKPKAYIVEGKCWVNNHAHVLKGKDGIYDDDFLYFALNWADYSDAVTGSTRLKLPQNTMNRLLVPNLPIEKQRQIAARLKAQLAEVDKARQAAEVQLRDANALRVAILRDTERELFSRAEIRPFSSYVRSYRNGFGKRPKEGEQGPIVLRIADVSSGIISIANPRHGEVSEKEAETYKLKKGDLLFIRVNGAKEIVGKCCVVDDSVPKGTIFNDHLIRVQITDDLDPYFARLCASLPRTRQLIEEVASTSAGQLTINQQLLNRLEIPSFSFGVQKKIVESVKMKFLQLDVLRSAALSSINDINMLPQKILSQAFEQ